MRKRYKEILIILYRMNKKYKCNVCVKEYLNYKSLWAHNKKFHKDINSLPVKQTEEINPTVYGCSICSKIYKHIQTRNCHEKACIKQQPNIELEVEKMKQETERMKQETLDKEQENKRIEQENKKIDLEALALKIKLQGMKKMDKKTFKYMNKLLMDRSTQNITNNTQNITNNYQIMALGKENLIDNLSRNEKRMILDSRHNSIEKMIEIVHCGTHDRFKNIVITNLKDKFAYRYDETKGYFITENKTDLLDNLIMYRIMDIEVIYDELSSANKIDNLTKKLIQEFLDKMENEEPFVYGEVEYANYKSYKMHNIKILLYNNQDRITKDIAFLIGDSKLPIEEIPRNVIVS